VEEIQNAVWEKTEIQRRRKTKIRKNGKENEKEEKKRVSYSYICE
jgi:hypothetical protein